MTSAINYQTISTTYPVAGQDNDSQGFRNNFTAIAAGLASAASEITALQSNTLKSANLADNSPAVNNMLGSLLYNGTFNQFYGAVGGTITASSSTAIDVTAGVIQEFIISNTGVVLTFTNWPAGGTYGVARVILYGDQNASRVVTLQTSLGTFIPSSNWSSTASGTGTKGSGTVGLTLNASGTYEVIEAWTIDGGGHVFIKNIGEY